MGKQVDNSFGDLSLESGKKLLFSLPFNGTVNPKLSSGSGIPECNSITVYIKGRNSGKAAVIDSKSMVEYSGTNNVAGNSGSIMFWIKPFNWSGKDNVIQPFVQLIDHDSKSNTSNMLIVQVINRTLSVILTKAQGNKLLKCSTIFHEKIAAWKQNEWHHIALGWSGKKIQCRIDGFPPSGPCNNSPDEFKNFTKIIVGGNRPEAEKTVITGKTAIQDLRIYDQPLSENEINEIIIGREIEFCGEDAEKTIPVVSALMCQTPPQIDGNLSENAWQHATQFPGFIDNTTRMYSENQTLTSVMYDPENLYVGMDSPIVKKSKESKNDFAAIIVRPSGRKTPIVIKVTPNGNIINENGKTIPDAHVKYACKIDNNRWRIEMALNFKGLGVASPCAKEQWNINFCRWWSDPLAQTSWVAQRIPSLQKIKIKELGCLIFNPGSPVIHIESFGKLWLKEHNLTCRFLVKEKGEALYVFSDALSSGKLSRGAHTEKHKTGKFCTLKLSPKTVGAGHIKRAEYISYSFVNKSFRKVYFRSDRLPVGKPDPIAIAKASYEQRKRLRITINTEGLPPALIGKTSIILGLYDGNKKICGAKTDDLSSSQTSVVFPLSKLVPGTTYSIKSEVKDNNDKVIGTANDKIIYPDCSVWLNNKLGTEDTVPTPWTPLTVNDKTVKCWGREYKFNNGNGFPAEIVTRGKSILAKPVKLYIITENGPVKLKADSGKFTENKSTSATYMTQSSANTISVQYKTTVEYDGMLRTDFSIIPSKPITVKEMVLQIPLKKEYAKYLGVTESIGAGQHSFHYYGKLPGKGYQCHFNPFLWLGDEDRGLLWFCESARNWRLKNKQDALNVVHENDTIVLNVNFITKPMLIKEKVNYTIGLQASPVRPLPENWRMLGKQCSFGPTTRKHFAYIPECLKAWDKRLKKVKSEGKMISAYTFLNNVSTNLPEYNLFFDEWKREKYASKGKYYMDVVAPNPKSWQDFIVWSYKKGMDDFDIDGVYYDLAWPSPTTNPDHGAYIDENGKPGKFWPIFASREIAKRAYVYFRGKKEQTAFIGHCSSNPITLPILSFCDYALDGEQFAGVLTSYMEQIPLDKMRAEFTCRQFGLMPFFLSEIAKSGNKNYTVKNEAPTAEMVALMYLHDIMLWPCFYNGRVVNRYQKVKLAFVDDKNIEFLPYWSNGKVFKSNNDNVKVSAYKKPGEILMIITNLNKDKTVADITVNCQAVGLDPSKVKFSDEVTKEPLEFKNSTITVPLKGRWLKMIHGKSTLNSETK